MTSGTPGGQWTMRQATTASTEHREYSRWEWPPSRSWHGLQWQQVRDLQSSSHLCDLFFWTFIEIIFQFFHQIALEVKKKTLHTRRLKTKREKNIRAPIIQSFYNIVRFGKKKIKFCAEFFVEYVWKMDCKWAGWLLKIISIKKQDEWDF